MKASLLIVAMMLASSCAMRMPQSPYQITERSKREVPAWVDLKPNELVEDKGQFKLLAVKDRILDLPLGIRQTQEVAFAAFETELHKLLRTELTNQLKGQTLNGGSKQDLDERVMAVVRRHHRDLARIEDIYYDKDASPAAQALAIGGTYRVFVLLHFSADKTGPLLEELKASLKRSPYGEVAALNPAFTSPKK